MDFSSPQQFEISGFYQHELEILASNSRLLEISPFNPQLREISSDQLEKLKEPSEEWKSYLPRGFIFSPNDNELIHYLRRKVLGGHIKPGIFTDLNIYKHEPHELPQFAVKNLLGGKMYFFSPVKRKDRSESKNERTVLNKGFWKASTSKDGVFTPTTNALSNGSKASLVYYTFGVENGEKVRRKQDWLMKEYRLNDQVVDQDGYVMTLCVIYYNSKSRNGER